MLIWAERRASHLYTGACPVRAEPVRMVPQTLLHYEAKTQGREKGGDTAPGKGKKECKGQENHTGCTLRQELTEWEQQSDHKLAHLGIF